MGGNPTLFLAPLNGSLAFQDRAGGGALTGSGAVRYAAAEGARTNYAPNPAINDITGITRVDSSNFTSALSLDSSFGNIGSKSAKIVASANTVATNSQICEVNLGTTVARCAKFTGGSIAHVHSVYIYTTHALKARLVPGFYDANLGFIGFSTGSLTDIPANTWTRLSGAFTSSALSSLTRTTVRLHSPGSGILPTVYITNNQIETGSTATDYFDGSTGGVWLDPITGILGTAHASPSVSQAVAWVEEGTTNLVANPTAETGTTSISNWTGATIARASTYARLGSYSIQVDTPGSTSGEGMGYVSTTGLNTVGATYTGTAYVRGTGSLRIVLNAAYTDASTASFGQTAFTATDSWTRVTITGTADAVKTVDYIRVLVITNETAVRTFYVDCAQLEQKAYATSYCDGSIGTGYAWSGTAHASSSTRTAAVLYTGWTSTRMNTIQGHASVRFMPKSNLAVNNRTLLVASRWNLDLDDHLTLYYNASTLSCGGETNGTGNSMGESGVVVVDTWKLAYFSWDSTTYRLGNGTTETDSGSRGATPVGTVNAGQQTIYISSDPAGNQHNGYIGPVLIADRPLTAKERATLAARTLWTFKMLTKRDMLLLRR